MKILYVSMHEVLEYEEILLLKELGHEVFSLGFSSTEAGRAYRPNLFNHQNDSNITKKWEELQINPASYGPGFYHYVKLTKDFVDNFDVIIVMHSSTFIETNWDVMKHKTVIWRTIGQSLETSENIMAPYRAQGMKIIRYSPKEREIPGFIGEDGLIRFYKDENQYGNWNGQKSQVITFSRIMMYADRYRHYTFFEETTRPFQRALFGLDSEKVGSWGKGMVPFEQLKQELCDNRVYFYTGTWPASYTLNFIEAWMTGIPIVAIGPSLGNLKHHGSNYNLYEIPSLIEHGKTGFFSDNPLELQDYIRNLFQSTALSQQISSEARKKAISIFGKNVALRAWNDFLNNEL
ncbi:glycosyltransferase [Peribacillus sp. NPDC096448]|uniref:glycosyltransferase n=1 Tax=Peribacillus sp. NPDC096448 TaxID=3364395 RepID=UPI0038074E2D